MSVTLPGTGSPVETVNGPNGTDQRQITNIGPRDGTAADSIGGLTEAAPGTDTASAGLNGRLQRIAQRITSMITLWGAATDAKNTATDTTSLTFMQVFKQISASVQTIATGGGGSSVTIADGAAATIGTKTDAASTATDATSTSQISILKQISKTLQAAAGAVATAFFSKITDGTNTAAVKAGSTAPVATDPALVVAIHPLSANANGQATMANSAPVAIASNQSAIPVSIATAPVLVAGSAIIGKVTTDQTTHGTTDLVAADITKIAGAAIPVGSGVMATAPRVALATDSPGIITLGQTTKASSVPVVLASDQGNLMIPPGATLVTASATGTTAATTATLPAAVGKTTYLCGFSIRANATAAATGNATVTGAISGTLNFTQWTAPLASGLGVVEPNLELPIPGSATNTAINVVSAAPGAGGTVSVSAWGYQL